VVKQCIANSAHISSSRTSAFIGCCVRMLCDMNQSYLGLIFVFDLAPIFAVVMGMRCIQNFLHTLRSKTMCMRVYI
jgi:hypothetical protein